MTSTLKVLFKVLASSGNTQQGTYLPCSKVEKVQRKISSAKATGRISGVLADRKEKGRLSGYEKCGQLESY
jgi:hypothetical protein